MPIPPPPLRPLLTAVPPGAALPMVDPPPGPPPADLALEPPPPPPLDGATRRVSWPPRVAEAALAVAAAAMTDALIPLRPFCLALPARFLFDD